MLAKRLVQNLHDEKSKREKSLINGQVQDFASYRFLVGQVKGLEDAINICQDIFRGNVDE